MSKIRDFFTNKRLNRLEADLLMIAQRKDSVIRFNPKGAFADAMRGSDGYTARIEEYRVWYTGVAANIRELYKSKYVDVDSINYFWRRVPFKVRMCHTGLPGLISRKMATVLFGSSYKITASVYKDKSSEIDEIASAKAQEIIDNLRVICDVDERFESAAQNESWSGHVFLKLSHDVSLTPYPILEVATVRDAEVVKERGITKAIIFHYYYTRNHKEYRLDEWYTTDTSGDACILYKLYVLDGNKEKEVALTTLPDTAELKDFVYKGLKGMLAFDKPNLTPSHEFPDSPYGASDYEGGIDSFDALDEVYSMIVQELRDNKTIRYIPDSMIPKDKDNSSTLLDDDFVTNYIKIKGDPDQDGKDKIETTFIKDKTEEHLAKYRTYLTTAINNAGLSPFALGITGLESINSSAESQQERNKVTLETRSRKLKLWVPFMEDVFTQMLIMNSWIQHNTSAIQEAFEKMDLNFNNLKLNIEFNDYVQDSVEKKITTWGNAKNQKVASTYEAVRRIHPEWDDEQVDNEVNLIRFEDGMSLDNPNNLPDLDKMTQQEEKEKEESEDDKDKNKEEPKEKEEKEKDDNDDGGE